MTQQLDAQAVQRRAYLRVQPDQTVDVIVGLHQSGGYRRRSAMHSSNAATASTGLLLAAQRRDYWRLPGVAGVDDYLTGGGCKACHLKLFTFDADWNQRLADEQAPRLGAEIIASFGLLRCALDAVFRPGSAVGVLAIRMSSRQWAGCGHVMRLSISAPGRCRRSG